MAGETIRREDIVAILERASVYALADDGLVEGYLEGRVNPLLRNLGIDSLAEMEICIAIEKDFGVSIIPTQLASFERLDDLVQEISRLQGGAQ